jgi:hypothetical protein
MGHTVRAVFVRGGSQGAAHYLYPFNAGCVHTVPLSHSVTQSRGNVTGGVSHLTGVGGVVAHREWCLWPHLLRDIHDRAPIYTQPSPPCEIRHIYTACYRTGRAVYTHTHTSPPCEISRTYTVRVSQGGRGSPSPSPLALAQLHLARSNPVPILRQPCPITHTQTHTHTHIPPCQLHHTSTS